MKKTLIILINVIIMAAILIFVVLYSGYENRDSYRRQIENFENTTVTMEQVTANYLEGEQSVCDVWAQYINSRKMTLEEATGYIRASHVLTNTSGHLILLDSFTGLSTRRSSVRRRSMTFPTGVWGCLKTFPGSMRSGSPSISPAPTQIR